MSDHGAAAAVSLEGGETAIATLQLPTRHRGRITLVRCELETHYPFALFRAWSVLHPQWSCVVYPRPATDAPAPPLAPLAPAGTSAGRGEEDFAGLREYHAGDPLKHVAWKALACSGEMLVKEFAGASGTVRLFDLEHAPGVDLEARIAVLARWVVDADAAGEVYGLALGTIRHAPAAGPAQRERCLTALADLPTDRRP